MKKLLILPLVLCSLSLFTPAHAEDSAGNSAVYSAIDENGQNIFTISAMLSEGDEYISKDNVLYRIETISGTIATAKRIGEETMPDVSWLDTGEAKPVFAREEDATGVSSDQTDNRKLIAMYVTHSDESYVPSDGTESIEGQGGIYDVARAFRDALQQRGIDVILDESTHLPHDSGAYRRSRRTAERLLQKRPDAIIDIHRDGIPDPEQYKTTLKGEQASQVRLLVGRSNQNSDVNRAFAKQIKAVADKQYPGLIKDIFIGKGNYNQDLSPNAILLEFGTHTLSKERVLNSTDIMAHVMSTALYGPETGSAKGEKNEAESNTPAAVKEKNKSSLSGIVLLLAITITGLLLFALAQTGGGKATGTKIGRNIRELTGGIIGKKKENKN